MADHARDDRMCRAVYGFALGDEIPLDQAVGERGGAQPRNAVHMREQVRTAARPGQRDRDQHVVKIGAQRFDAAGDRVVHGGTHHDVLGLLARRRGEPLPRMGIGRQPTLRKQGAEQLHHVERIAAGDLVQPRGKPTSAGGQVDVPQLADHLPDVILPERRKRQRRGARPRPECPGEPGGGGVAGQLAESERGAPQNRRLFEPPDRRVEEVTALRIAPVQIVEHHDHRLLSRECEQQLRDSLSQPPHLRGAPACHRLGEGGKSAPQLGSETGQLCQPLGVGAREARSVEAGCQQVHDQTVRQCRLGFLPSRSQGEAAIGHHAPQQLFHEPGLPYTGLAFDQHHPAGPPPD